MKKNESIADRIIRVLIAITLMVLFLNKTITGTWGWVALVIGIVLLLTSAVGFCPLYAILGIKTCKTKKNV